MSEPFLGSEAIARGALTRGQLRARYTAVHPGVYLPKGAEQTLPARARAAWLWTGRHGVIAGRAAAALHGAKWVDASTPIEIVAEHGRRQTGVIVREERLADDETVRIGDLPVTSPARTAFDLARHLPRDAAVVHLDSLAAATGVTSAAPNSSTAKDGSICASSPNTVGDTSCIVSGRPSRVVGGRHRLLPEGRAAAPGTTLV